MAIMQYEALIRQLLHQFPETRDSDTILYAYVITNIVGKERFETMLFKDLLAKVHQKALPTEDSIGRCRRRIQEVTPAYRGELYEQKHRKSKDIRQELGYRP